MASKIPEFKENLQGRLANFPLSSEKVLLPLYEAISNSIHAIEDGKEKSGLITIEIHRSPPQSKPISHEIKVTEPICGFTVTDNGIGFNDANMESFSTADSTLKQPRGGKGVGRLSWLKVFEKAEIDSVFVNQNKESHRRTFTFKAGNGQPISAYDLASAEGEKHCTSVKLSSILPPFQKSCPKGTQTIASRIIEHFLTMFIFNACPKIQLIDKTEGETLTLNKIFQNEYRTHSKHESFAIKDHKFRIYHFRMATKSSNPMHSVHFCALKRSVEDRDLSKSIANLNGPLNDTSFGTFAYAAYVVSDLFDETVNQERTKIELLHENTILENDEEPTREHLMREITKRCSGFLKTYLKPLKSAKLERIRAYAQVRPLYRPIVKLRPDWLDQIPYNATDEELEFELFKLSHKFELEMKQEGAELSRPVEVARKRTLTERKAKYHRYLDESNQVGLAKLAEYVIHRRTVIDFLSDSLKLGEGGKYSLEEVVHDVIFPLRKTSGDIHNPDHSNLWMIDDRLAYHYYLSSDLPLNSTGEVKVDKDAATDRPDLFILHPLNVLSTYDQPHAFVNTPQRPFQSITLVEFKRPNRDDYTETNPDKDPIGQVRRYAQKIRKGSVKDKDGEFVQVTEGTHIYAYIVCTLTPTFRSLAEYHGFTASPDNMGYFHWHPSSNLFTEVIDFSKLIQDAKKRNEVFFDKFNLPPLK